MMEQIRDCNMLVRVIKAEQKLLKSTPLPQHCIANIDMYTIDHQQNIDMYINGHQQNTEYEA